ncbi:hypothetical protein M8J77_008352 [Diaphorina citri]|nr:hypothetical protein M8J77_008352 [Diaphorina citri]
MDVQDDRKKGSAVEMERELEKWKNALEKRGLRNNRTKSVRLNFRMEEGQREHPDGEQLNMVDKFMYLGSILTKEGDLDCASSGCSMDELEESDRSRYCVIGR